MSAILLAALSFLGMTPQQIGIPDQWWCQDFVAAVVAEAGHTGGGWSPAAVMQSLVPLSAPEPGAVVAVDLFPGNDTVEHVAIVESVNEDGSVNTIEGNGPDATRVVRATRHTEEVLGFGETPESHAEYLDRLCAQLVEVKPWLGIDCEDYG